MKLTPTNEKLLFQFLQAHALFVYPELDTVVFKHTALNMSSRFQNLIDVISAVANSPPVPLPKVLMIADLLLLGEYG